MNDDLDLTPHEALVMAVGYLLITAFVIALIILPLAIGGLLISWFGW